MRMNMHDTPQRKTPVGRLLATLAMLVAVAALGACGGGGGGGASAPIAVMPPSGNVITPNDPATAGPPADAVTPPGAKPDAPTPPRRPETVRCAP